MDFNTYFSESQGQSNRWTLMLPNSQGKLQYLVARPSWSVSFDDPESIDYLLSDEPSKKVQWASEKGAVDYAKWNLEEPYNLKAKAVQVAVSLVPKMKPHQLVIYELFRRDAEKFWPSTTRINKSSIDVFNIDYTSRGQEVIYADRREAPQLTTVWFNYANLAGPWTTRENWLAPGSESYPKVIDNLIGLGIIKFTTKQGSMNYYERLDREPLLDDAQLTEQAAKQIINVDAKEKASRATDKNEKFGQVRAILRNSLIYYYAARILKKGWGAAGYPEMEALMWEHTHKDYETYINWSIPYTKLEGVRIPTSAIQKGLRRL